MFLQSFMARVRSRHQQPQCWMGSTGRWLDSAGEGQCSLVVRSQLPAELLKTRDGPTLTGEASSTGSFRSPLVMMDRDEFVAGLKVGGCLGTDDHDQITFTLGKERTFLNSNLYPPCFERANFPKQGEIMSEIS